jgi:hypothetical protein
MCLIYYLFITYMGYVVTPPWRYNTKYEFPLHYFCNKKTNLLGLFWTIPQLLQLHKVCLFNALFWFKASFLSCIKWFEQNSNSLFPSFFFFKFELCHVTIHSFSFSSLTFSIIFSAFFSYIVFFGKNKMIFIQIDRIHQIQLHIQFRWKLKGWIYEQTHPTQVKSIQRQNSYNK